MSNFEQISDVLGHHLELHQRIGNFYTGLSGEVKSPQASMLLNTLAGHEEKMRHELQEYSEQAPDGLMNTFFQYSHEQSVEGLFSLSKSSENLTANDVFDISSEFDAYLSDFYGEMIEVSDIDEAKDMFLNLRDQMEEEKKRLSLDMNGLLDM